MFIKSTYRRGSRKILEKRIAELKAKKVGLSPTNGEFWTLHVEIAWCEIELSLRAVQIAKLAATT
jgi:hypothetical protein